MFNFRFIIYFSNFQIVTLPVITNFGLIFKEKITSMQMPVTNVTFILNISSVLNMLTGLITGPLLNRFGYRKIALTSGILFSGGLLLTSFANSFTHFIITYSIITGIFDIISY